MSGPAPRPATAPSWQAAEPGRQELIRRLNQVPGATGRWSKMRADLLRLAAGDPELEALDLDFRHLFASWFNRGFLVLRPINWESPAHILEKIIAYEAVHAIDSWDDLRRRLEPADRRCFAFFHPAMPDEPLIFVEVALTRGSPARCRRCWPRTATLPPRGRYRGVLLHLELPGGPGQHFVRQFADQAGGGGSRPSCPGSRPSSPCRRSPASRWLEAKGIGADPDDATAHARSRRTTCSSAPSAATACRSTRWRGSTSATARGCTRSMRRRHLRQGDLRNRRAMVNYLYDLGEVAQNHERFATSHEIAASSGGHGAGRRQGAEKSNADQR
jgi:malonyl-CoA decarboxylase